MAKTKAKAKNTKQAKQQKQSKKPAPKAKKTESKVSAKSTKESKKEKEPKSAKKSVPVKDTKKSKKAGKEAEAPAVHTEGRTGKSKLPASLTNPLFIDMQKELDKEEKSLGFQRTDLFVTSHIENAMSTGILSQDFVLGGGYAGGRIAANPGAEGSGKTTSTLVSIANAAAQDIPSIVFDCEAEFDAAYADRMLARFGYNMRTMQGVYNKKRGLWEVPPMVRIYQINNGEQIFRMSIRAMKLLPDIRRDADGNYWSVTADKRGKETAVESNGKIQMALFYDGFAAMIPNILDGDDEKETIGAQALMFSRMLPRVASLMTKKNCTIIGTNQVRDKIGAFMGGVTHPGGNALKFYTALRTTFSAISASTAKYGEQTQAYFEEPGLNGGPDRYQFIKMQNNKNKAYTPKRSGLARIRFMKDGKPGDGICETFDCMTVLQATGQCVKVGKKLTFDIQPTKAKGGTLKLPFDPHSVNMKVSEFKRLVESREFKHSVYEHVRAQIRSGYAFDLERERVTNGKVSIEAEE